MRVRVRVVRPLVLGLLLGALGLGGYLLFLRYSVKAPGTVTREAFRSPYKTEEEWLLHEIVTDIAGMAAFAATRDPAQRCGARVTYDAQNVPQARIECPGRAAIVIALPLAHSTWAPEDYGALGAALVGGFGLQVPTASDRGEDVLLTRLLDLRADVIVAEDRRISQALSSTPAAPGLHEDAALLLAALALREASGSFCDPRQILCRMTAHLAFARALRGTGAHGRSGQWAEASLAALAARGAEAEARVRRLEAAADRTPADRAWSRLTRMRIDDDWRRLTDPANRTVAERLEWLRAMCATLGPAKALEAVERAHVDVEADAVARILGQRATVETGNRFLESGLAATWDEVDATYSRVRGGVAVGQARLAALNEPAQPFVSKDGPHVIAWGTWAAHYQRRLLDLVEQTQRHYRHALGIDEAADAHATQSRADLKGLTLFPIVDARWEDERDKPSPRRLNPALDVILEHPELITAATFSGFEGKTVRQRSRRRLPPRALWFATGTVRGTSFDAVSRSVGLGMNVDAISRMRAISPKDYHAVYADLWGARKLKPRPAEAEAAFGARMQYDPRAMREVMEAAYEPDPALCSKLLHRMCDLDEAQCVTLAAGCVDDRDDACAVVAYEKAISRSADRVWAAGNVLWLMSYHLQHGRPGRARFLAEMAAGVGSAAGFEAMAFFLEETGDYQGAERWFRAVRERYPDKGPDIILIAFYYRMARERHLAPYEAKFRAACAEVFPRGLEKTDLAALRDPPDEGIRFTTETPSLRKNGLRRGDIVVALEGWRVRTELQYDAVRAFSYEPDFRVLVWRSDRYIEVAARRLWRRFGVQTAPYRASRQPARARE